MNEPTFTFRDPPNDLPATNTLETFRSRPQLTPEERARRSTAYAHLCDVLIAVTDKDADHWNAHTYSELLAEAITELNNEHARIRP